MGLGFVFVCVFVVWDLGGFDRLVAIAFVRLLRCKFVTVCVL